ncbi:hypothetical protein [Streptomyces sp. NPDC048312]
MQEQQLHGAPVGPPRQPGDQARNGRELHAHLPRKETPASGLTEY